MVAAYGEGVTALDLFCQQPLNAPIPIWHAMPIIAIQANGESPSLQNCFASCGSSREKDDLGGQVKNYKKMGELRWKKVAMEKRSLLMSEAAKERWSEVIAQGALAHDERTKIARRESGYGPLPLRSHEPEARPDSSRPERYRNSDTSRDARFYRAAVKRPARTGPKRENGMRGTWGGSPST
jgi:hypothetical protein